MFQFLQTEWFNEIVSAGVRPSFFTHDFSVWIDLNTGAKSHLWITQKDNHIIFSDRYNKPESIKFTNCDMQEVLLRVRACMCGMDFINFAWTQLMIRHGMAEEVITKSIRFK